MMIGELAMLLVHYLERDTELGPTDAQNLAEQPDFFKYVRIPQQSRGYYISPSSRLAKAGELYTVTGCRPRSPKRKITRDGIKRLRNFACSGNPESTSVFHELFRSSASRKTNMEDLVAHRDNILALAHRYCPAAKIEIDRIFAENAKRFPKNSDLSNEEFTARIVLIDRRRTEIREEISALQESLRALHDEDNDLDKELDQLRYPQ